MRRVLPILLLAAALGGSASAAPADEVVLPRGDQPPALAIDHFPSRLHAVVWRNWQILPAERIADAVGAEPAQIEELAASMGLPANQPISDRFKPYFYKTVLRRNWHLLPYDQLLTLLEMDAEELAFLLHEDDFLYIKFGRSKPRCKPVRWQAPDESQQRRAAEIRDLVARRFGDLSAPAGAARFAFISDLTEPIAATNSGDPLPAAGGPRFLYSYFAVYGDPLLDPAVDPYPEGLLQQLAARGVNGVWLHVVLRQLAPGGPDFPEFGQDHERRLANLRRLVERAERHGIKIYLYLNEPRAMPLSFFESRPDLLGVKKNELATLCTSDARVRDWMRSALTHVFREAPGLGGAFTITASENLTSCASHNLHHQCSRCASRSAAEIIAEVNAVVEQGVHAGDPQAKVIAWDWGWNGHGLAPEHIAQLPRDTWLMSVSEWDLPIQRGGVESRVGEYSVSAVGPGPRATAQWKTARDRGLQTVAKVQVNNSWELSAVPWLPVPDLVAAHATRLRAAGVDGVMLSWSLGGYPSPNLEVMNRLLTDETATAEDVLQQTAVGRYGEAAAPQVRRAWTAFSTAFQEYPYSGAVVYRGPQHMGPANLLHVAPTGRAATMVGFPYDDLDGWRGPYPREDFIRQFETLAAGWQVGLKGLEAAAAVAEPDRRAVVEADLRLARAAHLHFASTAAQAQWIALRDQLSSHDTPETREEIAATLDAEDAFARQLYDLTRADSRIGFEASNAYYYLPLDLVEKTLNIDWVRRRIAEQ
ncbi:hypothetical protein [Alienimonas californiensis]|uniref:Uncharacterized protein n=1 Tax=Alienimonas californiensis TaxID=2527989 RepID=A0A517PE13_9PLAN|nr:hypothetical protein [Alienimonas californiensis]QDT17609.1 hypothetical protein CA12_37370 [Alienimonas californiensis]